MFVSSNSNITTSLLSFKTLKQCAKSVYINFGYIAPLVLPFFLFACSSYEPMIIDSSKDITAPPPGTVEEISYVGPDAVAPGLGLDVGLARVWGGDGQYNNDTKINDAKVKKLDAETKLDEKLDSYDENKTPHGIPEGFNMNGGFRGAADR